MTDTKTCATCRYVSMHKRPKVMSETGFDDQLMFADADADETVYTCRAFFLVTKDEAMHLQPGDPMPRCEHAGKEIGLVPITCSAYAEPVRKDLSELDRRIAERDARAKAKGGRE